MLGVGFGELLGRPVLVLIVLGLMLVAVALKKKWKKTGRWREADVCGGFVKAMRR